jgi:glucose-1-phosphate thymidylyltransferase
MSKDYPQHIAGIIPAAGRGTRLAPLPFSKELFPLGYQKIPIDNKVQWRPKTVSQYLIERMVTAGVKRIFFILGTAKEAIMEYYGNGGRFGIDIAYLFQEELAGMPFALDLARPWLRDETVLFGMPDTIIQPKDVFRRLLQAHVARQADLTLGVFRTETPQKFGMVELDADDRVIRNVDKPKETNLEYMWGIGCWSPSFTELMGEFLKNSPDAKREVVLSEVFQYAHEQNFNVRAVRLDDGEYLDIGTVDELRRAIERYSVIQSEDHE